MEDLYEILLEYACHPNPKIQEKARKLFYKLHQEAKKFADARDGYERQGCIYTKEEKLDLVCHSIDYLLRREYPDFDEISKYMNRTPTALDQQLQKLLVKSNWTCESLVQDYGITRIEAERLIAPQHRNILNK